MMPLLAEAIVEATPEKLAVGGFAVAVVSFLCYHFRSSLRNLEGRVKTLESVTIANSQFIAGVTAASMAGPTVPSSLIHDLHEQHKPSDASGIYKPLPVKPKRQ